MNDCQEGEVVAEKGSHEAVVFNLVPPQGVVQADLMKVSPPNPLDINFQVNDFLFIVYSLFLSLHNFPHLVDCEIYWDHLKKK